MELSETTLGHLRDEAYAYLAEEALRAKLAELEQERAKVASTRPPFGLLAGRERRAAFARSMSVVDESEAGLRDRLTQLAGIAAWLRPAIRADVSTYLASVSPDYCQQLQILARIDDWDRASQHVSELLLAFARDLRAMGRALTPEKKAHALVAFELGALRESAERLAALQGELSVIEQAARVLATEEVAAQLSFPELPNLQRLAWISRLAVLPPEQALVEVTEAEEEIRAFLARPDESRRAALQAMRDACAAHAAHVLEAYWDQLRAHARAHYVEARDIDDIIAMLRDRYVDADLRRQRSVQSVDPLLAR
jgi:hypothetical protein